MMMKKQEQSQKTQPKNNQDKFLSYLAWYIDMTFRSMIAILFVFGLVWLILPKASFTVKLVFLLLLSPFISIPLNKIKIGVPLLNFLYRKVEEYTDRYLEHRKRKKNDKF